MIGTGLAEIITLYFMEVVAPEDSVAELVLKIVTAEEEAFNQQLSSVSVEPVLQVFDPLFLKSWDICPVVDALTE